MFCSRCGTEATSSTKFCPTCGLDLSALTTGVGGQGAQGATARMPAAPEQDETSLIRDALKDEYDLEKELGRGGMAVVYKGRDKQLEREVAIKVLPFSLSFDAEFVERFQREARTAGKLEHPNIIPIYRVGKSGRVIYFVMKFIRGKSLSAVIEARGAIPVPEAKRFLIESARALGYAHKHGIVHRDIKPDNIMFDELGQAIVADFGIAKAQSGAKLTGTGMSIGTPHYMSPEQARAQNLDGRSDIYSLGVVAYQALTGHVPFDGEDSFSIGYKHIMEELPTPALDTADQRDLFTVVQKMMAKKPEDRFQTAEELIVALEGGAASSGMSMADMSTMPTRAIEPQKAPTSKGGPPALAGQATAPLPRASASMGKPADAADKGGPPSQGKRIGGGKPAKEEKSKAPMLIGIAAVVVLGGGAGYYFGVMKPGQTRVAAAAAARTAFVAESTRIEAESTAARLARATPQPDTSKPGGSVPPPGNIVLSGLPSNATVTVGGRRVTYTGGSVPSGNQQLVVEAPTFNRYTASVTVPPGGSVSRTITLVAAPPPAPPGTLRLEGVPAGARVTLGGRSIPITGQKDVPSGNQQLVVDGVAGMRRYTASVTIPQRNAITHTVRMIAGPAQDTTPRGTATVDCNHILTAVRNTGNACYDQRASPRSQPQVSMPTECPSNTRGATILVRVSTTGDVTGSPSVYGRSGCQAFDNLAQSAALNLQFIPARKGGNVVESWYTVLYSPRRQ